ncbi:alpha/beta hydrolase [Saccharopolyspora sp. 6M]|uniref:alpha/beta hydrolase n=1 Tax=Saccharopolyspora sp. 6M TaxID=2877237 RepID=UPI001CD53B88|nr:alpha/beta hydrolase [Saccharopolyspora sp. 6M]MCA1228051.1 alpha/beta hydrolase [Saccharopolyspora sp. 6M]
MSLTIFTAGDPESLRRLAESMGRYAAGVDDVAAGWFRTRSESESEWEGTASEAFRSAATRNGRDIVELAEICANLSRVLHVFADDLDTVRARMRQAEGIAHEAGLLVLNATIHPPHSSAGLPEPSLPGTSPPADPRKQAAYAEAGQTVADARGLEATAHERLLAGLRANSAGLEAIGLHAEWGRAAATATSPAAIGLAGMAMALDEWAAGATRALFEKAVLGGPHAVHGMWSALTSAQRADLLDRFPQLVGRTDGVPVAVRDSANRALLAGQRADLLGKMGELRALVETTRSAPGGRSAAQLARIRELRETVHFLDMIDDRLTGPPEKYLLGVDTTAHGRGTLIIAGGNPDTARHVVTSVPGTYSDLDGAKDVLERDERLRLLAERHAGGEPVAAVTWVGYESPDDFPSAAQDGFAVEAKGELARFQEGLRATHGGEPSHNTVLGHSYGSTVVGYAARDHGMATDEIVFLGSPGVGVEHARELGVPPEHVWSGTSGDDVIDHATPSLEPRDFFDGEDDHWFGMNPSDPHFGARSLETDPDGGHTDYWDRRTSLESMARVVAGVEKGHP